MNNALFAVVGLVLGFVAGWFVFAPAEVAEVEAEKPAVEAPVIPAEPEAAAPAAETPAAEVALPPQETVEPAPAEPKAAQ
jgi:hypothetical protein